ncbi:MAG: PaaI family thioesterase [Deltaproteobacteria bacterium]|nr:PaaI family thioesterase [Deltaproteobacteria bacterium]
MSPVKLPPPCMEFLNSELIEAGEGRARIRFVPDERMENPYGVIQGGILAAMLDNTIGPAVAFTHPDRASSTIHLAVNFLRSVRAGEVIVGTAEVVKSGRRQVYVEAQLERESDGALLVRASATNVFMDLPDGGGKPPANM